MSKKNIISYIKLQVLSGMANPSPPVGPALGQKGLNIMEFCNLFNKKTKSLEKGIPIPVIISVYSDKSFTFIIKTPPVSILLKRKLFLEKGSSKPKHNIVGTINKFQLLEIANIKLPDMTGYNLKSILKCIKGTAYSMGISIKNK